MMRVDELLEFLIDPDIEGWRMELVPESYDYICLYIRNPHKPTDFNKVMFNRKHDLEGNTDGGWEMSFARTRKVE